MTTAMFPIHVAQTLNLMLGTILHRCLYIFFVEKKSIINFVVM